MELTNGQIEIGIVFFYGFVAGLVVSILYAHERWKNFNYDEERRLQYQKETDERRRIRLEKYKEMRNPESQLRVIHKQEEYIRELLLEQARLHKQLNAFAGWPEYEHFHEDLMKKIDKRFESLRIEHDNI
tara:strand:+ start:20666 stop:21055 length:390 start_codon:yes stop_codon:yes gene_type:complete